MAALTLLFFFDIKFMVAGLNILGWDGVAVGGWLFVKLLGWAVEGNSGLRMLAAAGAIVLGAIGASVLLYGLFLQGAWACYIERTEPQTNRTFVVEYWENLMLRGSAQLYERFGPLLLPCDVETYTGDLSFADEPKVFLSSDGTEIVFDCFFIAPGFRLPLDEIK